MNLEQFPRLREALDYGYEFRIGHYFQQGFDLLKKNLGGFIGYTLLYLAIITVLGIIPIIGNIASFILTPPLAVGWFIVANKLHKNVPTEFGDFFKGFDYIGQLILIYIISILIYIAIMSPAIIVGVSFIYNITSRLELDTGVPTSLIITMLVITIPLIYLGVAWRWAPMFVVFHNMSFWDAMEASRKIVTKRWFSHFIMMLLIGLTFIASGFLFIGGIISAGVTDTLEIFSSTVVLVGLLLFMAASLMILPFYQCVEYAAFANITKLTSPDSVDDIVDHLIA
ncbi:MAG: hypothetical protein SFU99_22960 [Saprospiraceae bacterium]|nr:hypothetical protein [Saprospiraceae bacterium]